MDEQNQANGCLLGHVSCTTFNILAPIYKRLSDKNCENEFPELWVSRNESILDKLLEIKSSIICLQEFWVGNEELVKMYEKRLGEAGYRTYKLARTNNRGDGNDSVISALSIKCSNYSGSIYVSRNMIVKYQEPGLLAAVHQNSFHVLGYKECVINGIGDRVAQLLDLELVHPEDQIHKLGMRMILVNTHLIFPHDYRYCFVRLKQVYKILQFIESYCKEYKLPAVPIILCGDWNGSMKGNVCRFLLSQGFVSAYDIAHPYMGHNVGNCKQLQSKVTEGIYAPPSPQTDLSCLTFTQFSDALAKLQLIGPPHNVFTAEEIKDFWDQIDCNGDGMIDMSHFSNTFDHQTFQQQQGKYIDEAETQSEESADALTTVSKVGFNVDKAMLFPVEVEQGTWPESYSLSDHALLTVEVSMVHIPMLH
uniref:EF-hand domain-containing protein n=1 Tax=Daucus carota subsp. sativus TaxID=79200 RepID=A0A166DJY7_DAUCS